MTGATTTGRLHELPVDGGLLRHEDRDNDRDAILLLHAGVFSSWFVPLAACRALDDFRVIHVVRAGYAGGPAPSRILTPADHAAHCAALLEALGVDRAHVVGHSSGCTVALQLAVDRPGMVAGLVLSEPRSIPVLLDPADGALVGAKLGPVIGSAVAAAQRGDDQTAYTAFMDAVCGPAHREVVTAALGAEAVRHAERESRTFFINELRGVHGWSFDEQVAARITQPVLLVQGGASPPPVHRLVARLCGLLPHATVSTVARDDHLLPLRNPDAFAELIATFTRRHPITA